LEVEMWADGETHRHDATKRHLPRLTQTCLNCCKFYLYFLFIYKR